MSANPHANGGLLLRDLRMPDFRDYAVDVEQPGTGAVEATRVLGDVPARRDGATTSTDFRMFSPDENSSNRLQDVLEVTDRTWNAETAARTTTTSPSTAGSWRSCPSTPARAGSRATC